MKLAASFLVGSLFIVACGESAPPPPVVATPSSVSAVTTASAPPVASSSASTVATVEEPPVPMPPPLPPKVTCAKPKSLKAHPLKDEASILAADPLDTPTHWKHAAGSDSEESVSYGPFHYSMAQPFGGIVATEGKKVLFKIPEREIVGGAYELFLSPTGTMISRNYTRETNDVFDAKTGKSLFSVNYRAVFTPNDWYVLDLPWVDYVGSQWDHKDVRMWHYNGTSAIKSAFANWASALGNDAQKESFGAAICGDGSIFAISHPKAELVIFNGSADPAIATLPIASVKNPKPGAPVFTVSGKYVFIRADKTNAIYELVQ